MRVTRTLVRLGLALAALAPASAHAQRLGTTTITPAVLDRWIASHAAAQAEDRRRSPDVETLDFAQMEDAKDRWEECADGVRETTATPAELAKLTRLQAAMRKHMADPQSAQAIALSDTATTLMHAIERRAEPAVKAKCGLDPETRQQQAVEASMDAPVFDTDSMVAARMGLDGLELGRLRERIEMFLGAEGTPKPNVLWTAEELKVLQAYRARLDAALNGGEQG
jgi:hypothetical protein